ncbi:pantothenate kinase [Ranunculus cassubicifolius]
MSDVLEDDNNTIKEESILERTGTQDDVPYLALDIGGSLIKIVYFSRHEHSPIQDDMMVKPLEERSHPVHGGWLHFVKFETRKISQCLDYIKLKQLHYCGGNDPKAKVKGKAKIKVTGGGAHKYADVFKEQIGVTIEKEDEMDCLADGANFLLKVVQNEAFTYIEGKKESVNIDQNDLFPYLLVNIGSGVSINKVDGDGKSEIVDGTRIGGITCWGLGRFLTKCESFSEIIELSKCGNNKRIDMFVGDTFGNEKHVEKHAKKLTAPVSTNNGSFGRASMNIGSFGKTITENMALGDCKAEDISMSLLSMVSHNIGQIASLNARVYGTKRIFFGGSFIKDNTYALETISSSVHHKSKGTAKAMFLQHEGFIGALGALVRYDKHGLFKNEEPQIVEGTLKSTSTCKDLLWNFSD